MSLNKFSSSSDIKKWMKIGADDIKCTTLSVNGSPITGSVAVDSGSYSPTVNTSNGNLSLSSSVPARYMVIGDKMTIYHNGNFSVAVSSLTYDVNITLPSGYTVKTDLTLINATGTLSNSLHAPYTTSDVCSQKVTGNLVSIEFVSNGTNFLVTQNGEIGVTVTLDVVKV